MGFFQWLFKGRKREKVKEEEKEYVDKELIREIKHLGHSVHRAPDRVNELEQLLATHQVKFNQAIAAGMIKNKGNINAEVQKIRKKIDKVRKEKDRKKEKTIPFPGRNIDEGKKAA